MLNVFKLQNAISESYSGYNYSGYSEPYEIVGDLNESTFHMVNLGLADRATEIADYHAKASEIMVEAALSGDSYKLEVITESIFNKIVEQAKKFFNWLKEACKALVAKIKAFFYKLAGKTDKWLTEMEPYIKKAKEKKGSRDAETQMHDWNETAIITTLPNAVKIFLTSKDYSVNWAKECINSINGDMFKLLANNSDPDAFNNALQDYEDELNDDKLDEEKEETIKAFSGDLGFNNSTKDDLLSTIVKEYKGEKTTVKYGSKVDSMLNAIKNYNKSKDAITKAYTDNIKGCEKCIAELDKADKQFGKYTKERESTGTPNSTLISKYRFDDTDKDGITIRTNVRNADGKMQYDEDRDIDSAHTKRVKSANKASVKTTYNHAITHITNIVKHTQDIANSVNALNLKLLKEMVGEYMSVLSKFTGYREKKD